MSVQKHTRRVIVTTEPKCTTRAYVLPVAVSLQTQIQVYVRQTNASQADQSQEDDPQLIGLIIKTSKSGYLGGNDGWTMRG